MHPSLKRLAGALTLATLMLCPGPLAQAAETPGRPYTIDDLLNQAAFGAVSIDPTGRWVVYERQAPYASGPRFDYGLFTRSATGRLWIADARGGPPRPLLADGEGPGLTLGPWSPSGARLLVYRLRDDRWRVGVADPAAGTVRWLDLDPDVEAYGRVAQWRSDDELILIDRGDPALPYAIAWDAGAMAATIARWRAAATGSAPTATVMGSGAFRADTPVSPPVALVALDLRTGLRRPLVEGRLFDFELSPDGRRVAVMETGETPPVDQARPLWPVDRPEHRHVRIVDLETGAVRRPCDGCAVAPYLMAWSPRSDRVLVWITGPNGPTSGELAAFGADGSTQTFDRFGLEPDVAATLVAGFTTVRAAWLGDRPVLRSRRGPGERYDWRRLDREGPVNLTAGFAVPPSRLEGVAGEDLLALADGRAWRLSPSGRARPLGSATGLSPFTPFGPLTPPRLRLNATPPARDVLGVTAEGRLRSALDPAPAPAAPGVSSGPSSLIRPRAGQAGLRVEETVRNGVRALELRRPGGAPRILDTVNADLAGVRFARPEPVVHAGPAGERLTSWLYRPTVAGEGPVPLVVLTYPGFPSLPQADPAEFVTELNLQLLAAAGYAVLTPSAPRGFYPQEPAAGLADQILTVVDAALAQNPDLAADRLIYWGQSFGGYAGLVVATQTTRFRSIVVQASVSNLSSKWGEFAPWNRADPRWGLSMRPDAGWTEASQGAMGGPPWSDPDRYVRNSPLFQADRIQTPILILHGDRDMGLSGAEALYSALWRQNKDGRLVTWWGEGHTLQSPANIRALYAQILDWLSLTAGPDPARRSGPVPPSTGSNSPGSSPP